jgi:hypothetical protein
MPLLLQSVCAPITSLSGQLLIPPSGQGASPQKTSSITKALRSRDAPLLSLLPTARDLYFSTSTTVFFPRRNEWLLEWLVQRLKEDEGAAGRAARTSRDCWDFLLELIHTVDPAIVAVTLKRHGIVPLVAKTMEEVRGMEGEEDETTGLLDGVAAVLLTLRGIAHTESSISASLKSSPEICAGILGVFLTICRQLLERGLPVDQTWVDAVVDLWRSSVWGSANSKKVSIIHVGDAIGLTKLDFYGMVREMLGSCSSSFGCTEYNGFLEDDTRKHGG